MLSRLKSVFGVIWASPNSLLGLAVGVLGLATGGEVRIRSGCAEFSGGFVRWLLARFPIRPAAMTLGHTILGTDRGALDCVRDHELVHVRQYARWGPFFLPVYLGCSLILWMRGKNAYLDNPFEIEAFQKCAVRCDN